MTPSRVSIPYMCNARQAEIFPDGCALIPSLTAVSLCFKGHRNSFWTIYVTIICYGLTTYFICAVWAEKGRFLCNQSAVSAASGQHGHFVYENPKNRTTLPCRHHKLTQNFENVETLHSPNPWHQWHIINYVRVLLHHHEERQIKKALMGIRHIKTAIKIRRITNPHLWNL